MGQNHIPALCRAKNNAEGIMRTPNKNFKLGGIIDLRILPLQVYRYCQWSVAAIWSYLLSVSVSTVKQVWPVFGSSLKLTTKRNVATVKFKKHTFVHSWSLCWIVNWVKSIQMWENTSVLAVCCCSLCNMTPMLFACTNSINAAISSSVHTSFMLFFVSHCLWTVCFQREKLSIGF